jgi:hypothetical protein
MEGGGRNKKAAIPRGMSTKKSRFIDDLSI